MSHRFHPHPLSDESAIPRDGERVYTLHEDGRISDEGRYLGYHIGDPAVSEVFIPYITVTHPTKMIIPARVYKESMKKKKNPDVTAAWIKKTKAEWDEKLGRKRR